MNFSLRFRRAANTPDAGRVSAFDGFNERDIEIASSDDAAMHSTLTR